MGAFGFGRAESADSLVDFGVPNCVLRRELAGSCGAVGVVLRGDCLPAAVAVHRVNGQARLHHRYSYESAPATHSAVRGGDSMHGVGVVRHRALGRAARSLAVRVVHFGAVDCDGVDYARLANQYARDEYFGRGGDNGRVVWVCAGAGLGSVGDVGGGGAAEAAATHPRASDCRDDSRRGCAVFGLRADKLKHA